MTTRIQRNKRICRTLKCSFCKEYKSSWWGWLSTYLLNGSLTSSRRKDSRIWHTRNFSRPLKRKWRGRLTLRTSFSTQWSLFRRISSLMQLFSIILGSKETPPTRINAISARKTSSLTNNTLRCSDVDTISIECAWKKLEKTSVVFASMNMNIYVSFLYLVPLITYSFLTLEQII